MKMKTYFRCSKCRQLFRAGMRDTPVGFKEALPNVTDIRDDGTMMCDTCYDMECEGDAKADAISY